MHLIMLKTLRNTATLLFVTSLTLAQQDFEKSLDSIQTLDDVTIFFKKNKTVKGKVIVFNEEKHKTRMAANILSMSVGSKKYFKDAPQKTYYKVIEKNEIPYYRVSYVVLDGNVLSNSEISGIQKTVIQKYNEGYTFIDLAKQYSMDSSKNQGGDTGWFTIGERPEYFEFVAQNDEMEVGFIFNFEDVENKLTYIVVKTHMEKLIKESKVLKITEPRR